MTISLILNILYKYFVFKICKSNYIKLKITKNIILLFIFATGNFRARPYTIFKSLKLRATRSRYLNRYKYSKYKMI